MDERTGIGQSAGERPSSIPLFPLHTVLFPGGPLRLRIFEARYVDMLGRCLRASTPFGVVLITQGREAGGAAQTVAVGTSARVVDFEQLPDGLLGITARGEHRFKVVTQHCEADGLQVAQVQWCPTEPALELPADDALLADLLRRALPQLPKIYAESNIDYADASTVAFRLAEILPLSALDRQAMLEMDDPRERLALLRAQVRIQTT